VHKFLDFDLSIIDNPSMMVFDDTHDQYKKTLFAARIERDSLYEHRKKLDEERKQIETQIGQLDAVINGLLAIVNDLGPQDDTRIRDGHAIPDLSPDMGLADACRAVLAVRDRFMTAVRVRNELQLAKYPLDQANPLAGIHGVLKRFAESGEAEELEINKRIGYRLKERPKEIAGLSVDEIIAKLNKLSEVQPQVAAKPAVDKKK
jgi:hypothetical protein